VITLRTSHVEKVFAHAKATAPAECCGLIGGADDAAAQTIYPLENVASNPLVTYEAAPEDLFAAQRVMREREENLLAIYHSHPRSSDPIPSDTDVRLAYYPAAVYLIVGLADAQPVMRAFRISEKEHSWEEVEYEITGE
jgi:[CysO sulfur-carrier protein]-S-L-cysteine hydrolase